MMFRTASQVFLALLLVIASQVFLALLLLMDLKLPHLVIALRNSNNHEAD
jgi:hypothetical protein